MASGANRNYPKKKRLGQASEVPYNAPRPRNVSPPSGYNGPRPSKNEPKPRSPYPTKATRPPERNPDTWGPQGGSAAAQSGFNIYAAGQKRYGASGRSAPNIGPTSSPEGYAERDKTAAAKRNYMLRALKKKKGKKFFSPEALRTQRPGTYKTS